VYRRYCHAGTQKSAVQRQGQTAVEPGSGAATIEIECLRLSDPWMKMGMDIQAALKSLLSVDLGALVGVEFLAA